MYDGCVYDGWTFSHTPFLHTHVRYTPPTRPPHHTTTTTCTTTQTHTQAYLLFGDTQLLDAFADVYSAAMHFMQPPPSYASAGWLVDVHMDSGKLARSWVSSLSAFWPGLQALAGVRGWGEGCTAQGVGVSSVVHGVFSTCVFFAYGVFCLVIMQYSACIPSPTPPPRVHNDTPHSRSPHNTITQHPTRPFHRTTHTSHCSTSKLDCCMEALWVVA